MLKSNVNRRLRPKTNLVTAIVKDEWTLTNDAITFDTDGNLINGQHRLTACVETNTPIDVIVIRGLPPYAQLAMDTGRKRTVSDYLQLRGYKNCDRIAAIGASLERYERFGLIEAINNNRIGAYTIMSTCAYIEKNYESKIKPIYPDVVSVVTKFKGVYTSTLAPLFYMFKSIDIESYNHFIGMMTGKYIPNVTLIRLREALIKNSESRDRLPQIYIAAYVVKAWNAYMKGVEIRTFKYCPGGAKPEQFPEIAVLERDVA